MMENNNLKVKLHSFDENNNCTADIVLPKTGKSIYGFKVCPALGDGVHVHMPIWMGTTWTRQEITWPEVRKAVTYIYKEENINTSQGVEDDPISVRLYNLNDDGSCIADITINSDHTVVRGLSVTRTVNNGINVYMPNCMHTTWPYTSVSWETVREIVTRDYKIICNIPDSKRSLRKKEGTLAQKKETTESGRIANTDVNPFRFYPRTVLRLVNTEKMARLPVIVNAINEQSAKGIGPFDIMPLMWIERLRYMSKDMILRLLENGYISFEWKTTSDPAKLIKDVLDKLQSFNLIELSVFSTVGDDRQPDGTGKSNARYVTIGKNGSDLLHALGKSSRAYNAFDVLQDGNTVKRYLSANQWLIYWLTTYSEQTNSSYMTTCTIYQKGREFSGARVYATYTLNDITLVGEPVRRCEEFEVEERAEELRAKISRLASMFDNLDQLYVNTKQIIFPQRPVIVLICEDEEHIVEIKDTIEDIINENPEQTFWFTTDLRVFNKDKENNRFLHFKDGELTVIDENKFFGVN